MLGCTFVTILLLGLPLAPQAREELDVTFAAAALGGDYAAHLAVVERLAAAHGDDYELAWRASQAHVYAGDVVYLEAVVANLRALPGADVEALLAAEGRFAPAQRAAIFAHGTVARSWAQRAVALDPARVEGQFLLAVAISMYAIDAGVMTAISEGLLGEYERAAEAALALDPRYSGAGPVRLRARSYYTLPWPLRDLARSRDELRRAIGLAPRSARNQLYLGDTLWRLGERAAAVAAWEAGRGLATQAGDVFGLHLATIASLKLRAAQTG